MNVWKVKVFKESNSVTNTGKKKPAEVERKNRYYNKNGELAVIYNPSGLWSSPDCRPADMATDRVLVEHILREKDWTYALRRLLELGVVMEADDLKKQWCNLKVAYIPKGEMFTITGDGSGEKVIGRSDMDVA